ncbi:MAG: hypothetical protein CEE42_14110 [Promethearchaeota archaeon Loki_b31]|nr:MAG: hypothetical protein CEE42_14110 [Candidatus Lokiarchaeota archaeon Loki_b31]
MIRAFNVRIYPNKTQLTKIHKTIGCSRFIYNQMLFFILPEIFSVNKRFLVVFIRIIWKGHIF